MGNDNTTPVGATHYLPTKDGKASLFYKWEDVRFNDQSTKRVLVYFSTCGGGWMGSGEKNHEKFAKEKLIKIPT